MQMRATLVRCLGLSAALRRPLLRRRRPEARPYLLRAAPHALSPPTRPETGALHALLRALSCAASSRMGGGKSAAQLRARATPSAVVAGAPKENGAPAEACVRASRRSSGDALVWWLLASLAFAGAAFGWALLMPGGARDAAPSVSAGYAVDHFRLARAAVQRFRFVPGVTPLSSPVAPIVAVACYAVMLLAARRHVAQRSRPYDLELRPLVFLHNALLCCASSALLAALLAALLPEFLAADGGGAGAMRVWCDPRPHALAAHRATAVYYMNYIVKYYELLDTVRTRYGYRGGTLALC